MSDVQNVSSDGIEARTQERAGRVVTAMHELMHTIRREAAADLEPLGLAPEQVRFLKVLVRAGEPLRLSDVAHALRVAPRSVTTKVDDAEARGLVVRTADPDDRRATRVQLTDHGRDVLVQAEAVRRAHAAEILARLSDADQAELDRLLSRLVDGEPR